MSIALECFQVKWNHPYLLKYILIARFEVVNSGNAMRS
jgi:hypothetical protein